jgi:hypothetical protein
MTTATLFQHWQAGRISGFGSFQTAILKAYQLADAENMNILSNAFPQWFVKEMKM